MFKHRTGKDARAEKEATVPATIRLMRAGFGMELNIWPRWVAPLVIPSLAISLRRE